MKKFLKMFVLLLFIMFGFTGCVRLENFVKILPDGEIQTGLNVDIDKQKIDEAHENTKYDAQQTPNSIELVQFVVQQMLMQKLRMEQKFNSVPEESRPNYYISITCNGINWEEAIAKDVTNVKLTISFKSYEEYLKGQILFNGTGDGDSSKEDKVDYWTKNLFTYTHVIKNDTNFKATLMQTEDGSLVDDLQKAFHTFNINQDVKFVQLYGTTDRKLRSNATRTYSQSGVYYHVWELNSEQAQTPNALKMYYVYPNSQGWFLLTLILTAFFVLFYILYVIYKSPLKEKNKKQN